MATQSVEERLKAAIDRAARRLAQEHGGKPPVLQIQPDRARLSRGHLLLVPMLGTSSVLFRQSTRMTANTSTSLQKKVNACSLQRRRKITSVRTPRNSPCVHEFMTKVETLRCLRCLLAKPRTCPCLLKRPKVRACWAGLGRISGRTVMQLTLCRDSHTLTPLQRQ